MTTLDPLAYAYDVAVMDQQGKLLHLPRGSMTLEEQADEMSATLRCSFPNVMTTHGPMRDLVKPGTPLYCYVVQRGPSGSAVGTLAESGIAGSPWDPGWSGVGFGGSEGRTEIFRGSILEYGTSTDSIELVVLAHDVLHTLLKHEVDAYIAEGTAFKDALETLAAEWGMTVGRVDGPDANLPELTWRGEPAGTVLADMLEAAMGEGGGHFVIRATGDALEIVTPGSNEPIWLLAGSGRGAGTTRASVNIANLVGSVTVISEAEEAEDEDDKPTKKPPPKAVVKEISSNAGFNGAVKHVYVDSQSSEASAELEAQLTLARDGFPEWRFDHETVDVPLIRKYDKIAIDDDILTKADPLYVLAVTHNPSDMKMSLTLQTQEDFEREGDAARLDAQLQKLRGEEEEARDKQKKEEKKSKNARQTILDKAQPVMGTPYVWGGPGGRSNFDPNVCQSDCSGFVTWLCHQLGAPTGVYAFTDNMAGVSQLIGTNTLADAVAGDWILQKDPSVQAGATFYHIQMYLGSGGEVIEDGGSSSPSRIWVGGVISGYEVRRFQPLYLKLHGSSGGKTK